MLFVVYMKSIFFFSSPTPLQISKFSSYIYIFLIICLWYCVMLFSWCFSMSLCACWCLQWRPFLCEGSYILLYNINTKRTTGLWSNKYCFITAICSRQSRLKYCNTFSKFWSFLCQHWYKWGKTEDSHENQS